MNNDTHKEGKKATYQHELAARVETWWNNYEQATSSQNLVKFDWPKILYDFVKEVALESFKNGVTAGQRRTHRTNEEQSSRNANQPHQKQWTSAN